MIHTVGFSQFGQISPPLTRRSLDLNGQQVLFSDDFLRTVVSKYFLNSGAGVMDLGYEVPICSVKKSKVPDHSNETLNPLKYVQQIVTNDSVVCNCTNIH